MLNIKSMIYDEEFIESLPVDNNLAGMQFCQRFIDFNSKVSDQEKLKYYLEYIDSYAALEAFLASRNIKHNLTALSNDKFKNFDIIRTQFFQSFEMFENRLSLDEYESARNKYEGFFQNVFIYKFTDGDLKRIQTLIDELRNLITDSELFDANHKERLLVKLEGLQKELHKKVSSLDKFWGLIGEAGVVLGKFGKDVKPLVDIIKEIVGIIWRTQANAYELPSGTSLPLLKAKDDE
jgi:hypothetical protein